jgi:hypothetical protein
MSDQTFVRFEWPVPIKEDVNLIGDGERDRAVAFARSPFEFHLRMEDPSDPLCMGLTWALASLDSAEDVLAFARAHGPLGVGVNVTDPQPMSGGAFWTEPVATWLDAARTMRWMLETAEAIRTDDLDRIATLVETFDPGPEYAGGPAKGPHGLYPMFTVPPNLRRMMAESGLFPEGWDEARMWVGTPDRGMRRHGPRALLGTVVNGALGVAQPRLYLDAGGGVGRLSLSIAPMSLWGALVVQVARSVAGGIRFEKCKLDGCPNYFPLTPDVARTNRRYCSDACKSKDYRLKGPASKPKKTSRRKAMGGGAR